MKEKRDKIVLKIFDPKEGEKRPHNCSLCAIYKREAKKGNPDAMRFYRDHINEVVRRNNGATIVLDATQRTYMLPAA